MKIIVVLLMIVGVAGVSMGGMMFGDIGVAAMIAGVSAILSAIGLNIVRKKLPA